MKSKVNEKGLLSILIVIYILAIGNIVGCKKESKTFDNLPNVTGYPIVSTNQTKYYDTINEITAPTIGSPFYGQNANYFGNKVQYVNNGDSTITDLVTGLMWQQTPDRNGDGTINSSDKVTYLQAIAKASSPSPADIIS